MSIGQFLQSNMIIVGLLIVVVVAIIFYEVVNKLKSAAAVSNIQMSQLINQGANLIDVRTYAEYKKSHIAGAENVTKEQFDEFINKQSKKKEQAYVLYCQSGVTAKSLSQKMKNKGFANVYVLKLGLDGWVQDSLPTV